MAGKPLNFFQKIKQKTLGVFKLDKNSKSTPNASRYASPFSGSLFPMAKLKEVEDDETEQIPMPVITQNVNKDLSTSLGDLTYDPEANTLIIEVAPWVIKWTMNEALFRTLRSRNETFTLARITLSIENDPLLMPSCKWSVPSQALLNLGAILPSDWPYIRANINCQCSNPSLVAPNKYGDCEAFPNLVGCPSYSKGPGLDLAKAVYEDEIFVRLTQKNVSAQIPRYHVMGANTETVFSDYDTAFKMFSETVESLKENFEMTVVIPEEKKKTSYLETIFTETV